MYIIYNNNKELLTPETLQKAIDFAYSSNNENNPLGFSFQTEIDGTIIKHFWSILKESIGERINKDWKFFGKKDIITYKPVINY